MKVYDLPELAATLAPRRLEIISPVDAIGKKLSADAAKKAFAVTTSAYERKKAAKAFDLG